MPKQAPRKRQYLVCANCNHVKSLHVPPEKATAGHHGCMHEDVANGQGGCGDYCDCREYVETISTGHSGYTSDVRDSDIVTAG